MEDAAKTIINKLLDDCAEMVTNACIEAQQEVYEKETKPMILKLAQDLKNQVDLTTELADALEELMQGNEFDSDGQWGRIVIPSGIALNKAKAALKKIGRES